MANRPNQFESFARRVRRRYTALHLAERTGLGLLAGCAAALPMLAVLFWRGLPAVPGVFVLLAIGALSGFTWGVLTRPTILAAAIEADRQLGWADVLSSAWYVRSRPEPWAAAVVAEADACCRTASPSAVVFSRLGIGAWGGIGLATTLVLTLGLFTTYAVPTRAENQPTPPSDPLAALGQTESPRTSSHSGEWGRRVAHQAEPDETHASRMESPQAAGPKEGEQADSSAGADFSRDRSGGDPDGRGTGASSTDARSTRLPAIARTGTRAKGTAASARPSDGAGESTGDSNSGADTSASTAAGGHSSQTAPAWHATGSADDGEKAGQAVERGDIPDTYRDIIRDYFDHS